MTWHELSKKSSVFLLTTKILSQDLESYFRWWISWLPSRKRSHIPPWEKEKSSLKVHKSAWVWDMLVPRRVFHHPWIFPWKWSLTNIISLLPAPTLTCPLKRHDFKGKFIFQPSIYGGYASFHRGIINIIIVIITIIISSPWIKKTCPLFLLESRVFPKRPLV